MACAPEDIDDHVVVVVVVRVIVLLGTVAVVLAFPLVLVRVLEVVRVEDAAIQPLVVRVKQLTIAAAATGGAANAAAAAAVVVATLGRGAGDWSLAVAGHPSPAALGGRIQACTSRFPPRLRRWCIRGSRRRSCTRSRSTTTSALSISCRRRRCRPCRCRRRMLMVDVIVLVVVVMVMVVRRMMIIAIAVIGGVRFRLTVHGRRRQGRRGHADTPAGADFFIRAGLGGRDGVRRRSRGTCSFSFVRRWSAGCVVGCGG